GKLGNHPSKGVGAGDAVLQPEEAAKGRLLGWAVLGDRLPGLGTANHGAGGDDQDVSQAMEFVPGAAAGGGQVLKRSREGQRRHGESSWVPSDIAGNPYAVSSS